MPEPDWLHAAGNAISDLRSGRNTSKLELGDSVSLSESGINNLEDGHWNLWFLTDVRILIALAVALNCRFTIDKDGVRVEELPE